jgi:hypothetical protein
MAVHGILRYPTEPSSISGCDFGNQQRIKHEKLSMSSLDMHSSKAQNCLLLTHC